MDGDHLRQKPKKHQPRPCSSEQGSITVLFCVFALILVGAVSYSLYIGAQVSQRIQLQNATDAGALAVANHSAQGLNMMAANNLSIGASIHIAGTMPIIALYASVFKLLDANLFDGISMGGGMILEQINGKAYKDVFQKEVWDKLKFLPGAYMQAAAGTTKFNEFLMRYWMIPAPVRGVEITRANAPGAVAVPLQVSKISTPGVMAYAGLARTSPERTICHAIKSSRVSGTASERDNIITWLSGPLHTLNGGAGQGLQELAGVAAAITDFVNKFVPVRLGFTDCGYGLKVSLFALLDGVAGLAGSLPGIAVSNLRFKASVDQVIDQIKPDCDWWDAVCEGRVAACDAGLKHVAEAAGQVQTNIQGAFSIGSGSREAYERAGILYDSLAEMTRSPKPQALSLTNLRPDSGGRSQFTCEDSTGTHAGHVPLPAETGASCLNLRDVRPYCAFKPFLSVGPLKGALDAYSICTRSSTGPSNRAVHDRCRGYETFKANSSPNTHLDFGIEIADWSKQAKAFVDGIDTGRSDDEKKRLAASLGFVFANLPQEAFTQQNSILSVTANPLRTAEQLGPCPTGFEGTAGNGQKYCYQIPMAGLGQVPTATDLAQNDLTQDKTGALNSASGGLTELLQTSQSQADANAGRLEGTLARTQWAVAQVDVVFAAASPTDPTPASFKNTLFFPAWRSKLSHVRPGDLQAGLGLFSTGAGSTSPSVLSGIKAGEN